jgi:hypothetical protein
MKNAEIAKKFKELSHTSAALWKDQLSSLLKESEKR